MRHVTRGPWVLDLWRGADGGPVPTVHATKESRLGSGAIPTTQDRGVRSVGCCISRRHHRGRNCGTLPPCRRRYLPASDGSAHRVKGERSDRGFHHSTSSSVDGRVECAHADRDRVLPAYAGLWSQKEAEAEGVVFPRPAEPMSGPPSTSWWGALETTCLPPTSFTCGITGVAAI